VPTGLGKMHRGFVLTQDEPVSRGAPKLIFHVPKGFQPFRNFVQEIVRHGVHLRLIENNGLGSIRFLLAEKIDGDLFPVAVITK
jgi:hypothetical protein